MTGASYLLEFANKMVSDDIDAARDNKFKSAALSFNFDPEGTCASGDTKPREQKRLFIAMVFRDRPGRYPAYFRLLLECGSQPNICPESSKERRNVACTDARTKRNFGKYLTTMSRFF